MATVNAQNREVTFKIVYYGAGLSGKTTTLAHIHATSKPEHRGKMISLATPVDRTLYFDYLPIRLPKVRSLGVRLQLFTVPGQVYYNATRKLVLTGADAVVFVADSQPNRADADREALENLRDNLREHGRDLRSFPHVFQYNKRDLPQALPIADMQRMLNAYSARYFETTATDGTGVYEALEHVTGSALAAFEKDIPESMRRLSGEFGMVEGGLTEALRDKETPALPPAAPQVIPTLTAEPSAADRGRPGAPSPVPGEDIGLRAPGERAARAVVRSDGSGGRFSLEALFPAAQQSSVRVIQETVSEGRYAQAIELCDIEVTRQFAAVGQALGPAQAPRDPAMLPWMLGLDGGRYVTFRRIVRAARGSSTATLKMALEALLFLADVQRARDSFEQ